MLTITNGTIEYSHVSKLEDFGVNKKALTSLSFTVEEGGDHDAAIEQVTKLVKANVSKMLYGEKQAAAAAAAKTPAPAPAPAAAKTPEKPKPAGPRKTPAPAPAPTPAPATVDASAVVDEEVEEDFSATPAASTAKEIPDADLAAAMTKKNAEIKNSQAIRELVGSYAPQGHTGAFHAHDIPQAEREGFLAKLKELKPKA